MDLDVVIPVVSLAFLALGFILAYAKFQMDAKRARREQKIEDETAGEYRRGMRDSIDYVRRAISDPNTGLPALSEKLQGQVIRCHEIHAVLNETVKQHEKEIRELRTCLKCNSDKDE